MEQQLRDELTADIKSRAWRCSDAVEIELTKRVADVLSKQQPPSSETWQEFQAERATLFWLFDEQYRCDLMKREDAYKAQRPERFGCQHMICPSPPTEFCPKPWVPIEVSSDSDEQEDSDSW